MKTWLGVFVFGFATTVAYGDFAVERLHNWPHWRGPEANGVAPQGNPPLQWDEKTNVKWRIELPGRGSSTPIIWNDRVYILTAVNTGQAVATPPRPAEERPNPFNIKYPTTLYRFLVLCFDRATGRQLWEQTATEALPNEGHHHDNSYASASPTTDGRFLYVSFGSQGLYCYDLDGNLQWKRPLDAVQTRLSFGEACSPVVHGERIILNRDNDGQSQILVFDTGTGNLQWKSDREEMSAWATPLVVDQGGRTQVITNASNRVRSYDLATGKLLWQCGGQVGNVIPSPVRFGDLVLCLSGYRGSAALAIPIDSAGDLTGTDKIVWQYNRDTPYVPSPLLFGDQLYFNKSNSAIITCLDAATGKPIIEAQRLSDLNNIYASPVGAADRVYFVGRDGTTVVLKRGSTLEVLATNRLDDPIDASPAIAGSQMFLRGRKYLYCLEQR
jgi:outer membrane protein assembly factor BamB